MRHWILTENGSRCPSQVSPQCEIDVYCIASYLNGIYRRVKISHDPNNTTWAQSTNGFGHKIMTSQGWTPGQYLGARNANHADSFTSASASHIRVTLKDDTLGLGARAPTLGNDNVAAIDAFQGLLGRLNGKSDVQLHQEQRKRDDTRLALYASQKWQAVTFISGGYLVQEKIDDMAKLTSKKNQETAPDETPSISSTKDADQGTSQHEDEAPTDGIVSSGSSAETQNTKERTKKGKKTRETSKDKSDKKSPEEKDPKQDEREKRKAKKKRAKPEGNSEKKREKDDSKKRRRIEEESDNQLSAASGIDKKKSSMKPRERGASLQAPNPNWRHALRGRHIQQKRMAIMDDRSLGEVSIVRSWRKTTFNVLCVY